MSETKEKGPDFVWDETEILSSHARFLVESGAHDSEERAFEAALRDPGLMEWEWECLLEALTERLQEINPGGCWHVEVRNFGWRKSSGHKSFLARDARTFLQEILPRTQCAFRIFIDGREIQIQNFHHDSPWGDEWYTASPIRATAELAA